MEKDLSERKKRILQTLIESYIINPSPVSSSELKENFLPEVSSATIRSELATLEDMGFLVQPHISAGRIPSTKAYKYYVDELMHDSPLGKNEVERIKKHFNDRYLNIEDIVKQTAKLISDETNYTSIIVLNDIDRIKLREIKLVDLSDGTALVLVITDSGVLKDNVIQIPENIGGDIEIANGLLNKIFAGKTVKEVNSAKSEIDSEMGEFRELFDRVLEVLINYTGSKGQKVYLEGATKIFQHPESKDIENVKNFLSVIDKKDKICQIFSDNNDFNFDIKIGSDVDGELDNCAMVTAKYSIGGKEIGHAGVIGPCRMDYNKVVSVIKTVGNILNDLSPNNDGRNDKEE